MKEIFGSNFDPYFEGKFNIYVQISVLRPLLNFAILAAEYSKDFCFVVNRPRCSPVLLIPVGMVFLLLMFFLETAMVRFKTEI